MVIAPAVPGAGDAVPLFDDVVAVVDTEDAEAAVDADWLPVREAAGVGSVCRKRKQFWQTRTGFRMRKREISDSKREQLRQKTKPQLRQ